MCFILHALQISALDVYDHMQVYRFVKSDFFKIGISQQRTIMPRLSFSNVLLDDILTELKKEKSKLSKNNKILAEFDKYTALELDLIEREKLLRLAVQALSEIQKRLNALNHVSIIPEIIPSLIPSIRGVSSQLHDSYPDCSNQLCELSSVLGSILIDSASITEARFDFKQSNLDSAILLDKAKLMVDSKLDKLYPNLRFFTAQIT